MIQVSIEEDDLRRIRAGATAAPARTAIFRVEGPGALACLQGLLTNDLEKPGPASLVYGALLTAKGMIIVDLWVLRDAEGFTLLAPIESRDTVLALFKRTLPPRLARVSDLTGEWAAAWLLGPGVADRVTSAGLGALPNPGGVTTTEYEGQPLALASGTPTAWFRGLVIGPTGVVRGWLEHLGEEEVHPGGATDIEVARVLAGWPELGAEIGEKTLPQEVGYDALGGVSYTKGCYTGQETVARVHFRGHPNRELRGLVWEELGMLADSGVVIEEKEVGQASSVVVTPGRRFGLAVLRREVLPGATVVAGGCAATVVSLPFSLPPRAA